jgi:hypothetical protein
MIIITAGVSFAEDNTAGPMRRAVENRQENMQLRNMIQEKVAQVRQNSLTIRQLHLELQSKLMELRQALLQLKGDPELNEEKIAQIREGLRLIRENRRRLGATHGQVRAETLRLRANRLEHNLEACGQNLDNILAIQQTRIELLSTLLADTEALLAIL